MRKKTKTVAKEGPFGITTTPTPDEFELDIKTPTINYTEVPTYAQDLLLDNTVVVPEGLLQQLLETSKRYTQQLSTELLLNDAAMMLALEQAASYTETSLKSLGLEIETDDDLPILLNSLTKLHVVYFFLKKLRGVPVGIKKLFMRKFVALLTADCMDNMKKAQTSARMSKNLREVHGIVARSSPPADQPTRIVPPARSPRRAA